MLATLTRRVRLRRNRAPSRHLAVGFTLIELMVTVAVAVTVSMTAVPSFRQFVLNQRLKNASYDVVSALTLARSEAIARNASVSLVASGGDWSNGWCVTTTDCTAAIVQHEAFNGGITVRTYLLGTANAGPTTVTFGSAGRMTSVATLFAIDPATVVSGVRTRCVTLSLTGVPHSNTIDTGSCS